MFLAGLNARRTLYVAAGLVACATMAGACAVADPDTSQATLRYSGGWFSNQAWNKCIYPGERDVTSAGMQHFYYPAGQRTLTLSDEPGADAPPLLVSTNNQIVLKFAGTITYRLNTNCDPYTEYKTLPDGKRVVDRLWPGGLFQRFHDVIGRHSLAFATSGGDPQPPGWNTVVARYVGDPLRKAANDLGKRYSWQDLYSNPAKNAEWQAAVINALPQLVTAQAGADHFLVDNVQLLQPVIPATLNGEVENQAAAGLRRTTADTDRATADAFGGPGPYLDYLTRRASTEATNAIAQAIRDGKVRAIPVPVGSPVIVNSGG